MSDMVRYSVVTKKNKREIVLLKGRPCIWGKCAFCDYTADNSTSETEMVVFNKHVLQQVTGRYGALEVINSGSVFELPEPTLQAIKELVAEKKIQKLFFESYWGYKEHLQEIRNYFGVPIIFKCGIETFDNKFRTRVLRKGFTLDRPADAAKYFNSICLLVGVQGQTKDMIRQDMALLQNYFTYGCVNVYVNNSTNIKKDPDLVRWFTNEYGFLEEHPTLEVLWNNTDFGVGGFSCES